MFRDKAGRHYWFAKILKTRILSQNNMRPTYHNKDDGIDTGKELFVIKDGNTFIFVRTTSSAGNGIDRVLNMVNFYRHLYPVSKNMKQSGKPDVIIVLVYILINVGS